MQQPARSLLYILSKTCDGEVFLEYFRGVDDLKCVEARALSSIPFARASLAVGMCQLIKDMCMMAKCSRPTGPVTTILSLETNEKESSTSSATEASSVQISRISNSKHTSRRRGRKCRHNYPVACGRTALGTNSPKEARPRHAVSSPLRGKPHRTSQSSVLSAAVVPLPREARASVSGLVLAAAFDIRAARALGESLQDPVASGQVADGSVSIGVRRGKRGGEKRVVACLPACLPVCVMD